MTSTFTQYTALHSEFKDFLDDYGFTQSVLEPTRLSNNLDLVATNLPEQIHRVKVLPGISDHSIVYLEVAVTPNYSKQVRCKVWLYNQADRKGMCEYLAPRLGRVDNEHHPSPDKHWNAIEDLILEAMQVFIPKRQT